MLDQARLGLLQIPNLCAGVHPGNTLAHKFEQQRVHGFEAVRIADIIPQQNILLGKQNVVLAAFGKHNAILQQVVGAGEVFPKQRAPRFGQHMFFRLHQKLMDLLAHLPNHIAPPGLQFRKARFENVRLLTLLEVLPALANRLFAFQHEGRELASDFLDQELDERHAKQEIYLNVLLILCPRERRLHQFRQEPPERAGLRHF